MEIYSLASCLSDFASLVLIHYHKLITSSVQLIVGLSKPTPGSIYIKRFHDYGSPHQSPISSPERVGILFQFSER